MARKKENKTINEEIDLLLVMSDADGYKITSISEEEIKEKKGNPLFEIINALFCNKGYINNMTEQQANQNLFMILRRLAINYPLQANLFNNGKVNALNVIKFWSDYLYCGNVPRWAYTPGTTSKEKKKDYKNELSKNDIEEYCEFYDIEKKSFDFALKIFTEEAVNDVKEFKTYIKQLNSNINEKDSDNERDD